MNKGLLLLKKEPTTEPHQLSVVLEAEVSLRANAKDDEPRDCAKKVSRTHELDFIKLRRQPTKILYSNSKLFTLAY